MKEQILEQLRDFERELRTLKKSLASLNTKTVNRKTHQEQARNLATVWVEEIHPLLSRSFDIPTDIITKTHDHVERLFVLSRPNNLVTSYIKTIDAILSGFKDRYILPIQVSNNTLDGMPHLTGLLNSLEHAEENEYLQEAIKCAEHGFHRAAIIMGWCAVIDRLQLKVISIGYEEFNKASTKLKKSDKGKYKWWNKGQTVDTLTDLQRIFDNDLIIIFEGGLDIFDGNEADRLKILFEYRNQSAHPGNAPIDEPHIVAFFHDIVEIIFTNPKLEIK